MGDKLHLAATLQVRMAEEEKSAALEGGGLQMSIRPRRT
jgi:hypothetical protein